MGIQFCYYLRFDLKISDDLVAFEPLANLCNALSRVWNQETRLIDTHSRLVSPEYWVDFFNHHDSLEGSLESIDITNSMDLSFEATVLQSSWLYILDAMGAEADLKELDKSVAAHKFVGIQDSNRQEIEKILFSLDALGIESPLLKFLRKDWLRQKTKR
jgi:hypothetical protein